jgi:periplasmic protein TonB
MEAKKNPSKDLGLQRPKFFLIGLSLSIAIMISAFEWRTVKVKPITGCPKLIESEVLQIHPSPNIEPPSAPKQIPIREEKIIIKGLDHFIVVGNTIKDEVEPLINPEFPQSSQGQFSFDQPAEIDTTYIFVEKKPEPVFGFDNFYKELSTSMKYPSPARRMGIEGKVFVEFVVNKNGEPIDLKVIRGIGSGCDEEAMRVLALTKWEPGKQRGKPVRVRMVLPIFFKLSN